MRGATPGNGHRWPPVGNDGNENLKNLLSPGGHYIFTLQNEIGSTSVQIQCIPLYVPDAHLFQHLEAK